MHLGGKRRIVQMREDPVRIVQFEDVDNPNGRTPPPIWIILVVVVAVVTGGWLLATQGSTDTDPVTNPRLLPAIPDEASVVTTTVASVVTTTATTPTAADPVSVFGNPPASVTAETPQQLAGYVAVTSPDDPPFNQSIVWVFRPGGSLVSRADNIIGRGNAEYPMLITAGHLILGGRIFDIDLAEPPISLWTNGSVIPGSGPGAVWLTHRVERIQGDSVWVSPVDVESLTVGERIDVTDVFRRPIVGVADGLIVVDLEGELAFWSPTDGLVPLDQLGGIETVVAASGNIVQLWLQIPSGAHSPGTPHTTQLVIDTGSTLVGVLDIVSGEKVASFDLDHVPRPVTSACLSPDGQHVIVVSWNGEAVVGNIATGEVIDLNAVNAEFPIQQEHGIGWTTDDQLVFIGEGEIGEGEIGNRIVGFDITSGESFAVAQLDGPEDWWLAASGTMC